MTSAKIGQAIDRPRTRSTRIVAAGARTGSAGLDIGGEHIAFVAHRADQLVAARAAVARELAAEPADLDVDRAIEMFGILSAANGRAGNLA